MCLHAWCQVPEIKRFTYEQFEFLDKELKSRRIKPEDFYLVSVSS